MTDLVKTDCENRADNGASTACSDNHTTQMLRVLRQAIGVLRLIDV